jgi:protein SCO1/2
MRTWALVLALLLAAAAQAVPALKAGVFDPPHAAPGFRLAGSDGQELQLARWRGKLVLLVFGFTNCPEVCPTTLLTLAQARQQLGAAAAEVQVVYVTVDPERDTLPKIKAYLAAFDKSFVGGTEKPAVLEAMRQRYGVVAAKLAAKPGADAANYGMNHSTSVFLIDRQGRLRAMMPFGHPAQDFVHDLKLMLASR